VLVVHGLSQNITLHLDVVLLPLDVSLLFSLQVLHHVSLREEVRLSGRLDQSLPVKVLSLELATRLPDQNFQRNHDGVVPHLTNGEVGIA